jgi:hypothetical protein
MALTDTDRHRLTAATVLTLLALPALWWANTSEGSSAPNLAVAGIDAGADVVVEPGAPLVGAGVTFEAGPPVFLDGPASAAGAGQSAIAVPAKPLIEGVPAQATFRGNVQRGNCIVSGPTSGSEITVVNLDNNRSVTCTVVLAPGTVAGELVMNTSAFATIADLTDAPISVEIRR